MDKLKKYCKLKAKINKLEAQIEELKKKKEKEDIFGGTKYYSTFDN